MPAAALEELARGRDAARRGQRLAALAAYARAMQAAPEWAEPHRLCVPVARSAGDLATARDSLLWLLAREARLAVQKDPRLAEAHYILGVAADERGNDAAALASWERALAADPGHLGARDLLATGLLRAGRVEQAESQRALHGAVTSVHAAGFKKQGAAARAATLEPLLEELPPWPYAEVELAEAWMELGRNAEALPLLRGVLEQENTTATHALLYEVLEALGKHAAAQRHGRLAGVLPPGTSAGTAESERRP